MITVEELDAIKRSGKNGMYDAALEVVKDFINSSKDSISFEDFAVAVAYRAYCYGVSHGVREAEKRLGGKGEADVC